MSKLIRASDVKGDTSYDIILRAWLSHKLESLPEAQSQMLERWQMVDKLIKQGEIVVELSGNPVQITRFNFTSLVEWLRERYKVSARTAYEDIANAKRFFLSCEGREDVEYARGVMVEIGERMMHAAFDSGDMKAAAAFYKELNKIKGLHEQRVDAPDYSEFTPPTMVLITDPTELGFERIENPDEVVKRILNEKRKDFIESVAEDAEELEDE